MKVLSPLGCEAEANLFQLICIVDNRRFNGAVSWLQYPRVAFTISHGGSVLFHRPQQTVTACTAGWTVYPGYMGGCTGWVHRVGTPLSTAFTLFYRSFPLLRAEKGVP